MMHVHRSIGIDGTSDIESTDEIMDGSWIEMIDPTPEEISLVSDVVHVPEDMLRAALDEEETPRLETIDDFTIVLIDIPRELAVKEGCRYDTFPMGLVIGRKHFITICLESTSILNIEGRKGDAIDTRKRTRMLLQILYRTSQHYLGLLRVIDADSRRVEGRLHRSTRNRELIELLNLEKSLVFLSTSLRANDAVLNRLLTIQPLDMYEADMDILEDVIIENDQAMEMSSIYTNILSGTMDAYASIINNNMNQVVKSLTSITVILSIPTMVASFYGMNVNLPFDDDPGLFPYIILFSFVMSSLAVLFMRWRDLL